MLARGLLTHIKQVNSWILEKITLVAIILSIHCFDTWRAALKQHDLVHIDGLMAWLLFVLNTSSSWWGVTARDLHLFSQLLSTSFYFWGDPLAECFFHFWRLSLKCWCCYWPVLLCDKPLLIPLALCTAILVCTHLPLTYCQFSSFLSSLAISEFTVLCASSPLFWQHLCQLSITTASTSSHWEVCRVVASALISWCNLSHANTRIIQVPWLLYVLTLIWHLF